MQVSDAMTDSAEELAPARQVVPDADEDDLEPVLVAWKGQQLDGGWLIDHLFIARWREQRPLLRRRRPYAVVDEPVWRAVLTRAKIMALPDLTRDCVFRLELERARELAVSVGAGRGSPRQVGIPLAAFKRLDAPARNHTATAARPDETIPRPPLTILGILEGDEFPDDAASRDEELIYGWPSRDDRR
jgi:hypothetical protein